jgi:purine-binding chemotaxis protein CheW
MAMNPAEKSKDPKAAAEAAQYLTFMLDGEMFALGIQAVKEIIGYGNLTVVPMMPECIRGVINLRGAVVPVMDLSARFGRKPGAVTKRTCVVIVEVEAEGTRQDVGMIVDAVNAVQDLLPSEIEPPPPFGARLRAELIEGMGKVGGRFVIILDADRIWSIELTAMASAAA